MSKVVKIENLKLINGDCLELMKAYPDKYFDLAVVDPDYQLGKKISSGGTWAAKYKGFDGNLGNRPTKEYFDELFRVSKNQIVWGGNYFIDMLYPTRCFLIWDKKARMPHLQIVSLLGHHLMLMLKYLLTLEIPRKQEYIFVKNLFHYMNGYLKTMPKRDIK